MHPASALILSIILFFMEDLNHDVGPDFLHPYQFYFSSESATWEEAKRVCAGLSDYGRLAVLDTVLRHRQAGKYLSSHMSGGSELWIGGECESNFCQWVNKNKVDPSWAPWNSAPKKTTTIKDGKMAIMVVDKLNYSWSLKTSKQTKKYLCEF